MRVGCFEVGVKSSLWWKDIFTLCFDDQGAGCFDENMIRKVGQGDATRFWKDRWCGGNLLKDTFSRLYRLSSQKNYTIQQLGVWDNGVWRWKLKWWR